MIGATQSVKDQFAAIASSINEEWRSIGHKTQRAELLSMILGLAELVAAEAQAQERVRIVGYLRSPAPRSRDVDRDCLDTVARLVERGEHLPGVRP